jgi:hypothetical protein
LTSLIDSGNPGTEFEPLVARALDELFFPSVNYITHLYAEPDPHLAADDGNGVILLQWF